MIKALKETGKYRSPDADITWRRTRHNLYLTAVLNWSKCADTLILPPPEIGSCSDWRNVLSQNDELATFRASWDLRRVNSATLESVSKRLSEFSVT
jgi:hypothetical protein